MTERNVDRRVYEEELDPWLPPKIIDVHVHIGLAEHTGAVTEERRRSNWAYEVGLAQSWEQLRKNVQTLFPGRQMEVLAFGNPFRETDLERNNDYVWSGARDPANGASGLLVTRPEWDAAVIEDAMRKGFTGIKPYPDLAPEGAGEPSIYDFLPPSHLDILNRLGGILMLHLPRQGRLGDPDNIRELKEISKRYPAVRIIVAHVGRSFCLPTAQRGLPELAGLPNVWYDISAVMNADVIAYTIETAGLERALYGSDMPITLIRGIREHVGESYVNYTDGDYSWNTNRKPPEIEANYTYYVYEILRALIEAAKKLGLGNDAVAKVMYANAAGLLRA